MNTKLTLISPGNIPRSLLRSSLFWIPRSLLRGSSLRKIKRVFIKKKHFKCTYSIDYNLHHSATKPSKVAGIVGWVNKKSKTDLSITNAIEEGMETIIIYACMDDAAWYYKTIEPLIKKYSTIIKYAGCMKDKQRIYDTISDVYDLSESSISDDIKKECNLTKTNYHGK